MLKSNRSHPDPVPLVLSFSAARRTTFKTRYFHNFYTILDIRSQFQTYTNHDNIIFRTEKETIKYRRDIDITTWNWALEIKIHQNALKIWTRFHSGALLCGTKHDRWRIPIIHQLNPTLLLSNIRWNLFGNVKQIYIILTLEIMIYNKKPRSN